VEQRHDGAAQHAFVGRAGHVHRDVAHPEGGSEECKAAEGHRETRSDGGSDARGGQSDRPNREAPGDGRCGTETGNDVTGCQQADDRPGSESKDEPSHVQRAGVESVAHRGDPGDPTGHPKAAEPEDHERGVAPGDDLVTRKAISVAVGRSSSDGFRHGVPGRRRSWADGQIESIRLGYQATGSSDLTGQTGR